MLAEQLIRLSRWTASGVQYPCEDRSGAAPSKPVVGCLLRRWLSNHQSHADLSNDDRRFIASLVKSGVSLREDWPRPWCSSIQAWIGPRLYLSAAGNFVTHHCYATLACSHLGKSTATFYDWPRLIDSALRDIHRDGLTPLVVPNTTLYESVSIFLNTNQWNRLVISVAERTTGPTAWLSERLAELRDVDRIERLRQCVDVSPTLDREYSTHDGPLQDRLAFILADRVYALFVRQNGRLARLLRQRLIEPDLPLGSVRILLPDRSRTSQSSSEQRLSRTQSSERCNDWLRLGAVGWYLPQTERRFPVHASNCHMRRSPATMHWTAPVAMCASVQSKTVSGSEVQQPGYLVHCTRTIVGRLPEEDATTYIHRLRCGDQQYEEHALFNLQRIANQRKLIGTQHITRTDHRCVSFSAVPLLELLARRRYRSHLSRWDWEPYGVIVSRLALKSVGARAVIYGSEDDYRQLDSIDRPFFQPARTRSKAGTIQDWEQEHEWRLTGDLDFRQLPNRSIQFFVYTRQQAMQLARRIPYPVWWVNDALP